MTHKMVWTKNGWQKQSLSNAELSLLASPASRVGHSFEYDQSNVNNKTDAGILQQIQNTVQTNSPGLEIDKLPASIRQLFQCPDEWHFNGGRLFKIIDPITQVYEDGNWGIDLAEIEKSIPLEETTCWEDAACWTGTIVEEELQEDQEPPYIPPNKKYSMVSDSKVSYSAQAAEERVEFFYQLFGEAMCCSNEVDLYGVNHTGGFFGKIRGMNAHDRDLTNRWSIQDRKTKDGKVIKSAFSIAREQFIKDWRGSQDDLQKALWRQFDRQAGVILPQYDDNGNKISPRASFKDSIWRQKRAQAFTELFLTKAQWNAIYKALSVVQERIKLNKRSSRSREIVLKTLREDFQNIETLSELKDHMTMAQRRKISDNGVIKFSLIDQISIKDEARWRKACRQKRNSLINKILVQRKGKDNV